MPAPTETTDEGIQNVSIGEDHPNMDVSVPLEDDGFTLFSNGKKKSGSRKDSRNQSKRQIHAMNRSDMEGRHSASAGFGKSKWAKPSSDRMSANQPNLPTNNTNQAEFLPLGQTPSISSLQENLMSAVSPSLDTNIANSDVSTLNLHSEDFKWQCQTQSLSALMEDYGTYDPDWMKVPPPDHSLASTDSVKDDNIATKNLHEPLTNHMTNETKEAGANRLQVHGRAPIHVEFVSFGYRHGVPHEIRHHSTGNSYRQPLPPFDTRTVLAPIPPHLAWMDGKSSVVKMTMLRWQPATSKSQSKPDEVNVRDYAQDILGPRVADALVDAMVIGGHGYASPLTITIFVGSELGRHRSVVASELGATALRQRLRQNLGHRFQCAVSVGCRHRDITPQHHHSGNSTASKKQKAFEED